MKLNTQQELAANHVDGPCLVISVPGSGKTRLLVERTARLIEAGIPPKEILCVTFTNKAADEMKERIYKLIGSDQVGSFIGTFHSLCAMILRRFGHHIGYDSSYSIADSDDQYELVRKIGREFGKKLEKSEIYDIIKAVNDMRENMWDHETFEDKLGDVDYLIRIGDEYIDRLKAMNTIDFSGLLSETITLLEQEKDLREKIQNRFKYIQVDETQDTNFAQFHLLNMFAGKWGNIMMVGDISQSIYGWRGARHQNIRDFLNKHEDCKVIELSLNYRSTPQIIKHAETLIKNNESHMAEKFETENPDGEPVIVRGFNNQMAEGKFVAMQAKRLVEEGGWAYHDMAVLYRMNSMSEPIERAMVQEGISYNVIGGKSFYDRREVKDCIAMLKFYTNPHDSIAFHRIAGVTKGLGDVTIGKIEKDARLSNIDMLVACKNMSENSNSVNIKKACDRVYRAFERLKASDQDPASILNNAVSYLQYETHLNSICKDDDEIADRMGNVRQLVDSAADFASIQKNNTIDRFLQMVALITASDTKEKKDKISLMTLHACKGLEFPIIFMIGVEDGILPHYMAVAENPTEGLEEERRLCYVGMTRAEKLLYMSHCRYRVQFGRNGKGSFNKKCKPSKFLFESKLLERNQGIYA